MSNPPTPTTHIRNAYVLHKLDVAIRDARMELRDMPPGTADVLAGWEREVARLRDEQAGT